MQRMTTFVACNAKFFPPPWVINDETVVGYYLTKLKKIAGHCQLNNMAPVIFVCQAIVKNSISVLPSKEFERLLGLIFHARKQAYVNLSEN